MLEKLREAEIRYESMLHRLSEPSVIADNKKYTALMREHKMMTPLIEKYRCYMTCEREIEELTELAACEENPEFRKELENEVRALKERLDAYYEELKILLIPRDPDDLKSVVVEIRAGAGGEEAALFASDLYRMYAMYSDTKGLKTERISFNETELGGFKEISFSVKGEGAFSRFKFESGVHRVQRVPATESQGRIQTSTVTVAVLPETEDVEVAINPEDITVETCKSSGAGGQHINKTESAIRIIHKPTGSVVGCQTERSQLQNKETAMKMLRAKLYDIEKTKRDAEISSNRKNQIGTGDRSERIRTYNYPQGRITDHRIGLTVYSLDSFMNGDINMMIEALISADTAEKLKGSDY